MLLTITEILDDGGFLEVQSDWAQNIVVGFGHLGGNTGGIVANQLKFWLDALILMRATKLHAL